MLEMFGSGTAATVSPIQEINHDSKSATNRMHLLTNDAADDILTIPLGDITQRVMDTVFDIQVFILVLVSLGSPNSSVWPSVA